MSETSRVQVNDVRSYSSKAVAIVELFGSNMHSDYRAVEEWLKTSKHRDCGADTLAEIYDREVGLPSEASPHPERPSA